MKKQKKIFSFRIIKYSNKKRQKINNKRIRNNKRKKCLKNLFAKKNQEKKFKARKQNILTAKCYEITSLTLYGIVKERTKNKKTKKTKKKKKYNSS